MLNANLKYRAASLAIGSRNRCTVLLNDGLDDVQPESGDDRLGGHVRLENPGQQFLGDAWAVVADDDFSLAALNPDQSGAGFGGIYKQVHQHPLPGGGIALYAKLRLDLLGEIELRAVDAFQVILGELNGAVDDRRKFAA